MKLIISIMIGAVLALAACGIIAGSQQRAVKRSDNQKPPESASMNGKDNSNLSKDPSQNTEVCENQSTREAYENCLLDEFKKLTANLQTEFESALEMVAKDFTDTDVGNLKNTQVKWLAYRDSECQAEKDLYGNGTDAVAVARKCLIELTDKRIKEIGLIYGKK